MMIERKGRTRRRTALAGTALIALLVWGCEGNHAFAPVDVGPEITDILSPGSVQSGESFSVGVRALGLVRVDSIVVRFQVGSHEETQVAAQTEGIQMDFSAQFDFNVPAGVTDTLGTLEAYAVDAQRNIGPLSAITLRAIDGSAPTVGISFPGDRIGLGTEIPVTITAEDNIGLAQIGFRVLGPGGEIIEEVLIPEDGKSVSRTLLFSVPDDLPLGDVAVVGIAIDHDGLVGLSDPVPVTLIDVDEPLVQIVTPDPGDAVPAQDSIFTQVMLNDNDAVDSVTIDGVAHRGDPTLGTDTVVVRFEPRTVVFAGTVSDTLLQRFLTPAADSTSEDAYIRAVAYDREGNASRDSVLISLLIDDVAPQVTIVDPPDGFVHGVGDSILVSADIRELPADIRSGVRTLTFEGLAFRGDPELGTFEAVERFEPRTVTFDPPRVENLRVSRFIRPTAETTSEFVHIIATATDAWGNQRADTVRIRVVNDTIAPQIEISEPDPGVSRTAGDSVLVSATVFEPSAFSQSGVSSVTVDGVAYRSTAFGPQIINKFGARRSEFDPARDDVTLTFYLQPTSDVVAEDVWIRFWARDLIGNTSRDSVMITLTAPPPAPPAVEIGMLEPWTPRPDAPTGPTDATSLVASEVAWLPARRDGAREGARRRTGTDRAY